MIATSNARIKLGAYYKFVYKCKKCGKRYGSDKEELIKQLCPPCDPKVKNAFKRRKKLKNKTLNKVKGVTLKLKQRFKYKLNNKK